MLVIRRQQFDTFRTQLKLQFEHEMAAYLRRYFPFEAAHGSLNLWVRQGLEGHPARILDASGVLALPRPDGNARGRLRRRPADSVGGHRHHQPRCAPALQRITQVYERGIKYLEATGGPKCAWLVRAKLRVRKQDMAVLNHGVHPLAHCPEVFRDVLAGLYAQKADVAQRRRSRSPVRFAIERTRAAGARTAAPALIHAVHMFFLGWRFDADPCYPWAAAALADDAHGDAEERYRRMHEQSLDYLDCSFQFRV